MKAKVVITKGWNGGEVIKETVVSGANRNMLDAKASKWIRANAPDPRHIRPCWTMTIIKYREKTQCFSVGMKAIMAIDND